MFSIHIYITNDWIFLFRNERKYKASTLFPKWGVGRQYICIADEIIVDSVNGRSTIGDRRNIEQNHEGIRSCLINWRHLIANISTYVTLSMNIGGWASEYSIHSMSVRLLCLTVMHTNIKTTGALFYTCHTNFLPPNSFCVQVQTHKTK